MFSWIKKYYKTTEADAETGIRNFGVVVPGKIFRGAKPEERFNLVQLGQYHKIKTWIDLRNLDTGDSQAQNFQAKMHNMQRLPYPISDKEFVEGEIFDTVIAWLSNSSLYPIFINCEGGRHRTGIMVAAYRAVVEKKSWEEIKKELDSYGWYSEFGHQVLMESLMRYLEKTCPEEYTMTVEFH